MVELNGLTYTATPVQIDAAKKQQMQAELKKPADAVKTQTPQGVVDYAKVERIREELKRRVEWTVDEDGEIHTRVVAEDGKIIRYLPPEKLQQILNDMYSVEKGSIINEKA